MRRNSRISLRPTSFMFRFFDVNDKYKSSEMLSFIFFSDDTNIFYPHKDIKRLAETLRIELTKVEEKEVMVVDELNF